MKGKNTRPIFENDGFVGWSVTKHSYRKEFLEELERFIAGRKRLVVAEARRRQDARPSGVKP